MVTSASRRLRFVFMTAVNALAWLGALSLPVGWLPEFDLVDALVLFGVSMMAMEVAAAGGALLFGVVTERPELAGAFLDTFGLSMLAYSFVYMSMRLGLGDMAQVPDQYGWWVRGFVLVSIMVGVLRMTAGVRTKVLVVGIALVPTLTVPVGDLVVLTITAVLAGVTGLVRARVPARWLIGAGRGVLTLSIVAVLWSVSVSHDLRLLPCQLVIGGGSVAIMGVGLRGIEAVLQPAGHAASLRGRRHAPVRRTPDQSPSAHLVKEYMS